MDTILVIGSNSFSGATFINYALGKSVEVHGISRSPEAHEVFLPYRWRKSNNFFFHRFDINRNAGEIEKLIDDVKPSYVINFAAQSMVAQSWDFPEHWFNTNVVSNVKLHNILRKKSFLKRYVHISTPEVYGNCIGFVSEDQSFSPSTPYAVSRAATDLSLRTFFSAYDFPVVTTRAANVYGPGQQLYRIIPRTILFILLGKKLKLHGGGVSTRSFIHMNDVSVATWDVMVNGKLGDTYHISTAEIISIRDLVEQICVKLDADFNQHVEIVGERLGKDSSYQLDRSKIERELNWKATVTLDQGLDETIKWVQENLSVLEKQKFDYEHKI